MCMYSYSHKSTSIQSFFHMFVIRFTTNVIKIRNFNLQPWQAFRFVFRFGVFFSKPLLCCVSTYSYSLLGHYQQSTPKVIIRWTDKIINYKSKTINHGTQNVLSFLFSKPTLYFSSSLS